MKTAEVQYNENSILVLFDRTIETMEGNKHHDELLFPVKLARLLFKEIGDQVPKEDRVDVKRINKGFQFTYKGVKCRAV